jgi:hypothetical protein
VVAVAKQDVVEERQKQTMSFPRTDLELAQAIADHRRRSKGGFIARAAVICEALRRGLKSIAEEEGVKTRR